MTDLEELSAAAREALAPEQVVYLRPRLRRALQVLPGVLAELAGHRAARACVCEASGPDGRGCAQGETT